MDMQYLIWIVAGAAGILLFKFISLLSWDVLKYLPMPSGLVYTDEHSRKKGKKDYMFWLLIAGAVLAIVLGSTYIDDHPSWMPWILLGSFSAPTVLLFLLRLIVSIGLGIFVLYERTEVIYEYCKTGLITHLKKKGRIE